MATVNMYWYDSAWKETDTLHVYDGSWKQVTECYIYDAGTWKLCHVAPVTLNSFTISDTSFGCDPTLGVFRAAWTYTAYTTTPWTVKLEYSFDSGASWTFFGSYSLTSSPQDLTIEGVPGFTSLDNTYFRLKVEYTTQTAISGSNTPQTVTPSYICV
jgi:hypothetical protein